MLLLKEYALSFLGTPYVYGGSNRLTGMDCSEFIQELLRSVGIDPPGDQTAQAIYNHFERNGKHTHPALGNLVFFGETVLKITHVAMALDPYRMIESGGGDSTTLITPVDAAKRGAMVRIRPIRKDLVACIRPNYSRIGAL